MRIRKARIQDIINILGEELVRIEGSTEGFIDNIADTYHTIETTLDWINPNKENKGEMVLLSPAKAILIDETVEITEKIKVLNKTLIVVKNPKKALAIVGNVFFADTYNPGTHQTSIIDVEASISDSATIGPFCQIGKAKIGNGTIVCANVRIYDDVVIGDHCFIKEGAIIGGPGYGYEIDNEGNRFRFPQIGGVIIGNYVDIGGNTCIDRGALSDTIIEDYAKIDNLCHIAHNAHIGKNAMIVACSEISGSCTIGNNSWVGPNSSVRDWRCVGEDTTIGMGSNVVKDIPANEVWAGNPARKLR